jgi:uncharacterized protein (DUF58 family)
MASGRRRHTLTTRGRCFVAAGTTLTLGGMLLGFSDLTRVGVLLVVLPLAALLLTRRRPPAIAISREVQPARLGLDQRAEVRVTFQNRGGRRSPLFLAEERLDYALGDRPRFVLPRMDPGARRRLTYRVSSHVRGRHLLGPIALRQRDPFGLTHVGLVLRSTTEVLVLPRIEPLGAARPRGEGLGSEGEIPHMVASHGEDDVSIRTYREGDELRRVHWPATAHRGEIMVRQEDRPARRRAVLLLDSRSAAHRGSGSTSSFEWAVSALASIAVRLVSEGYAVHLVSDGTLADGASGQLVDLDAILSALALAQPGPAEAFDAAVREGQTLAATGGVVVAVVADHDEDALRRLTAVRQPGTVGLLLLLDTRSFDNRAEDYERPESTTAMSSIPGTAGWTTQVVGSGDSVRAVWERATVTGSLQQVGAR